MRQGSYRKKNNKTTKNPQQRKKQTNILIKIINFPMAWEQNKASEYLQATLVAASSNF